MGNSVSIMDYGATVQSINIVDAEGEVIDCCLGYSTVAEYEEHTDFMGAVSAAWATASAEAVFL